MFFMTAKKYETAAEARGITIIEKTWNLGGKGNSPQNYSAFQYSIPT